MTVAIYTFVCTLEDGIRKDRLSNFEMALCAKHVPKNAKLARRAPDCHCELCTYNEDRECNKGFGTNDEYHGGW
jgi:hypothetical protein